MSVVKGKISFNKANKPAATEERVKAQFWINVGYSVEVNGEHKFVSIPMGIPLDGIELLPTNTRNAEYNMLNQARNELFKELLEHAEQLEPGQESSVGLEIQLRRIDAPTEELTTTSGNPFLRPAK